MVMQIPAPQSEQPDAATPGMAVLAGGCFWCTEAVYLALEGVTRVFSGYTGGARETANYRAVCSGTTGHAEAVQIYFDPARLSFGRLLQVFFAVAHDPTQRNRQGNDVGTQYRSAIFAVNAAQRQMANDYIAELNATGLFGQPIVTEVSLLENFYPAEDYHQDYARRNPDQPYICAVALPKVEKLRHTFPQYLQTKESWEMPTSSAGYDLTPIDADTRAEMAKDLPAEVRHVLFEHGTEPPFCGGLLHEKEAGNYVCALCSLPLFRSANKFDSGTGWPSFWEPFAPDHIRELTDTSYGRVRTEIRCARCDSHLGHVFPDGPEPTGLRYCLNSAALRFEPEAG